MHFLKMLFAPLGAIIDYIQNHFKALLFVLLLFVIFFPMPDDGFETVNLQRIELNGPIIDTTEVVRSLDEARANPQIQGVLLVADSPGGAVAPSVEVAYAVKRLQATKPVVVYAKGMLASGSYYASIWADEIIANPGGMVGSIGVIMQGANLEGLMEKVGIGTQVVKAGKYKQAGTPDRTWTPYERAEIEKVIKDTYAMFVHDVADARGLDPDKSSVYADAHIFTARQAKAVGLIDSVGVEYDARQRLEARSGVSDPVWSEESDMERFFRALGVEGSSMLQLYFPHMVLK
ncbi:signal peptide peptidase SppA [Sulfurimonas sp. HSL-3221]|uniref:signal peptide peptidase SppA n=1 Tax=Sulfurimonadaceae TaxID=2771471 RepID=UPI001E2C3D8F|nr:signal peptide peptidase SppA [Sulfurimonas sp. HSL-3221]UFS63531.1 signal peptide peptidase SppA [Sulfurimonas sp. HSL-3221]